MIDDFVLVEGTEEEAAIIDDKIIDFNRSNVPFIQEDPFKRISYLIKDKDGQIIGGILVLFYCWNIAYIDVLFVEEKSRKKGFGKVLMDKVILEAKNIGATLIHLDTFDWQEKDFYVKQGFEIFGVLEDCPPGHNRYYLKKKL